MEKKNRRPRIEIDDKAFSVQLEKFRAGEITADKAAAALFISRRTFFRRLKELAQ